MIRFLEVVKNNRNLTIYRLSEPTIPLERVLTLNTQQDFSSIAKMKKSCVRHLRNYMDKIEQAELEVKTKIEAWKNYSVKKRQRRLLRKISI
jgi:hypothetical protein